MCKAFYKYFLITSTSFMATSGLYFVCLTRWLWPSPIYDYSSTDWRKVPEATGAICLIIFSIGLLIVLRARIKELIIYGLLLSLALAIILSILILQLAQKQTFLDLSDIFLITVVIIFFAIIINIFLFAASIRQQARTLKREKFIAVHL